MQQPKSEIDLRNIVQDEFFPKNKYDSTYEDRKIDFIVRTLDTFGESEPLLWAESKYHNTDKYKMLAQLILTANKYKSNTTPKFLGVFDIDKIGFIEYSNILDLYELNDFNWTQTPSAVDDKTIKSVRENINDAEFIVFNFNNEIKELKEFINKNFQVGTEVRKKEITDHNFISIYNFWLDEVAPQIRIENVEKALKETGINNADFYIADLMSEENEAIKDLKVNLNNNKYTANYKGNNFNIHFKDDGKAHERFWNKYKRPPAEQYQNIIIQRRDLLAATEIRQRKGAFFTPQQWVELSQQYLRNAFGNDFENEYYIWDCCCGTGNLLVGLNNSDRIFASTLDDADIDIVKNMIDNNGLNLRKKNVFQFDFLNDVWDICNEDILSGEKHTKIPEKLLNIINDKEKIKKLIIYINPPYAEAGNNNKGKDNGKSGVAFHDIRTKYRQYGSATNELFTQFFIRINEELSGCKLAAFSKMKYVNASNFTKFRENWNGEFINGFVCPADTFDNVKGSFPIGFLVWDLEK